MDKQGAVAVAPSTCPSSAAHTRAHQPPASLASVGMDVIGPSELHTSQRAADPHPKANSSPGSTKGPGRWAEHPLLRVPLAWTGLHL